MDCKHYWKPFGSSNGHKRYKCVYCGKTTTKPLPDNEEKHMFVMTNYEIFKSYIRGVSNRKLATMMSKSKDWVHRNNKKFLDNTPDVQLFGDFFTDRIILVDTIWQPIRNRKGEKLFKGKKGFWILQDALTGLIGGCYPTDKDVPVFAKDVLDGIKPKTVICDLRAEYKKMDKKIDMIDFQFCMAHLSRALGREFLFLNRSRSRYGKVRNKVTEDEKQIEKLLQKWLFKCDHEAFLKINDIVDAGRNVDNITLQNFKKRLASYHKYIDTSMKDCRTTNRLEGFNSQIRNSMQVRRGLETESAYKHYQWFCFLHNVTKKRGSISPFEASLGWTLKKEPTWEDIVEHRYEYGETISDSQLFKKAMINLRQSLNFH